MLSVGQVSDHGENIVYASDFLAGTAVHFLNYNIAFSIGSVIEIIGFDIKVYIRFVFVLIMIRKVR